MFLKDAKCPTMQPGNIRLNLPDGEIGVQILENVHGRDVFVLQTIARQPNLYLMEVFITADWRDVEYRSFSVSLL
jgi:phosphoribosylpyrophosphate synthetase